MSNQELLRELLETANPNRFSLSSSLVDRIPVIDTGTYECSDFGRPKTAEDWAAFYAEHSESRRRYGLAHEQERELLKDDSLIDIITEHLNISAEQFRQWRDWHNDEYRCTGTTKKGTRCKKTADSGGWSLDTEPTKFIAGHNDRCRLHVDEEAFEEWSRRFNEQNKISPAVERLLERLELASDPEEIVKIAYEIEIKIPYMLRTSLRELLLEHRPDIESEDLLVMRLRLQLRGEIERTYLDKDLEGDRERQRNRDDDDDDE